MSDNNIVTSESLKKTEVAKKAKAPAKKAPAKKVAAPKAEAVVIPENFVVVKFESGASYNSNGYRFTRDNPIQEVPSEFAEFLLTLDNFRRLDALEIEEYLASKED